MSADHPGFFPDDEHVVSDLFTVFCALVATAGAVAAVFIAIVSTSLLTLFQATVHVVAVLVLWAMLWLLYTME